MENSLRVSAPEMLKGNCERKRERKRAVGACENKFHGYFQ